MGRKKNDGNGGAAILCIVILVVTTVWEFLLRNAYHGLLGYRAIILFAIWRIICSVIHNIHYDKFVSIYNPFFLLLIFGGFYFSSRYLLGRFIPVRLICGINWFEWFDKNYFWRKYISVKRQVLSAPFMMLSFTPYYVLYKNWKRRKEAY